MNLRERAESDLGLTLEGRWGLPVVLVAPDGARQEDLRGQVMYDIVRMDPDTGNEVTIDSPVVTLRRSSLTRVPVAGETWGIEFPESPSETAPMVQHILTPDRPPEGGKSIGFIRLYPQRITQVDTTAPIITVDDLVADTDTPTITGTIDDMLADITITVDGTDYAPDSVVDNAWSVQVGPLAQDQVYTVTAQATDAAGNVGSSTGSLTVPLLTVFRDILYLPGDVLGTADTQIALSASDVVEFDIATTDANTGNFLADSIPISTVTGFVADGKVRTVTFTAVGGETIDNFFADSGGLNNFVGHCLRINVAGVNYPLTPRNNTTAEADGGLGPDITWTNVTDDNWESYTKTLDIATDNVGTIAEAWVGPDLENAVKGLDAGWVDNGGGSYTFTGPVGGNANLFDLGDTTTGFAVLVTYDSPDPTGLRIILGTGVSASGDTAFYLLADNETNVINAGIISGSAVTRDVSNIDVKHVLEIV